jgi:hypothetical protein
MNPTWGVYPLHGKAPDGTRTDVTGAAVRWVVRWRVNGGEHKRTLKRKGYAETFIKSLISAQEQGLEADDRGFPIKDGTQSAADHGPSTRVPEAPPSRSFENYCHVVWWDNEGSAKSHKNRTGHRKNMEDAIKWLRYRAGDPRVGRKPNTEVGASIRLDDLDSDDIKYALRCRRNSNDRNAATNARRIEAAVRKSDSVEVDLLPLTATDRTVQAFWVTLGMIVRAAAASRQTDRGCLEGGAAKMAPKPKRQPVSERLVPSISEVFDLADAISRLGPLMPDGKHSGERLRALILTAGSLGPRPGELTAHQPDWFEQQDNLLYVIFRETETLHYDTEAGIAGRNIGPLKHRDEGEYRRVPVLADVTEALRTHLDRGYALPDRTFPGPGGTAHLTWGNITDVYWRPACEKVFAGSSKPLLAQMSPKTLRKAAITFWLDSGIDLTQAAEWAGHSEDVAQRYYAGRVAPGFAREAAMLAASVEGVRAVRAA